MARVWRIEEDELPAGSEAAEGDIVMRRTGEEVAVGRVHGGAVTWSDQRLSTSLLPPGALDEVDPVGALQRPRQQEPLLTAAQGVETAAADRGA